MDKILSDYKHFTLMIFMLVTIFIIWIPSVILSLFLGEKVRRSIANFFIMCE